jgi:rhamnosyltransferase
VNSSVSAVIVTYKTPKIRIEKLLSVITPQVGNVFVIENGGSELSGIEYINNPQNNLAIAQNIGIRAAISKGAEYILLLDDDSIPNPKMVSDLLENIRDYDIIGASLRSYSAIRQPFSTSAIRPTRNDSIRDCFWLISSGSLIKKQVFEKIGFMDEAMNIDMVDMDFCTRAKLEGFKIGKAKTEMEHQEGELKSSVFGNYKSYNRERYFIRARNKRLYIHRYFLKYPLQSAYVALSIFKELLKILLLENGKKEKLHSYLNGLRQKFN